MFLRNVWELDPATFFGKLIKNWLPVKVTHGMTSASDSSRCDDIDEMSIFKIKCMVPDKWLRIAQFYAHGRCIKVVCVFSTWVHHLLVLYRAGRSSFVSSVRFGVVYLHLRVSCVSLLPPAACSNSSSSGGADVTRSTHTFGRVSRQPEQLRTAREMCDPCAEVARDTCLNKKGTFPFHRFGSRV